MYVYGPVPSRRLGRSLGVSPIPPKTCSYTCVYCQLGRTTDLTATRRSFYPKEDILSEIISKGRVADLDYVTFVGDGEPTLCEDLGWLLEETKNKLKAKTAVITNGSLLFLESVREDLNRADVIMPTLDAGDEKVFRAVNRPHRSITFDLMLKGLVDFRSEYSGQIWLEVMLVKGVNDSESELKSIGEAVNLISPDRVYVVTPIRPPAESWVEPPEPEAVIMAQELIGESVPIVDRESGEFRLDEYSDARQAILEIGSRHPLREEQAIEIERGFDISGIIDEMIGNGKLVRVDFKNATYLLPGHFKRG